MQTIKVKGMKIRIVIFILIFTSSYATYAQSDKARGNAYVEVENYTAAAEAYSRCMEEDDYCFRKYVELIYDNKIAVQSPDEMFRIAYSKAMKGNAIAQNYLGSICYAEGIGTPVNLAKAFEWSLKAAKQGYATAQNNVAVFLFQGMGVNKDISQAIKWWIEAADNGNSDAQAWLRACYKDGIGVRQSDQKAFEWYNLAGNNGNERALGELFYCYYEGAGVEKNDVMAVKYLELATKKGDIYCMLLLGICHLQGIGVPVNREIGMTLIKIAANEGDNDAKAYLSFIVNNGAMPNLSIDKRTGKTQIVIEG